MPLGVLSDIAVKSTMKQKLDIEFHNYRILGACNPALPDKALASEDKIGSMLPCNVSAQDLSEGRVELAAINRRCQVNLSRPRILRSRGISCRDGHGFPLRHRAEAVQMSGEGGTA